MTNIASTIKFSLAVLLVLAGFLGFMTLGFWQVHRLAWKEDLLARIARYQAESVELASYVRDSESEFRRGTLIGHWDSAATFQTHNITMNSNFGYWIVTPLILADGTRIIVNRGWVQDGQQARVLKRALPAGDVTVTGALRRPGILDDQKQMAGYGGPWVLFMQSSVPADHPELVAAPVAVELPNDHKQYAIFWFLMAVLLPVLAGFSLLKARSASSPNP